MLQSLSNNFYHNTQPNNFEFSYEVNFSKSFFRKNIGNFTDLPNKKKSNLEVPCKQNRFGKWNSCKRLPKQNCFGYRTHVNVYQIS